MKATTGALALALLSAATLWANSRLPTLTTARSAHQLSLQEAVRAYPVHLRAVVTYYDPYNDPRHRALFVADSSGCIFVALSSFPTVAFKSGERIDIQGVSGLGDFAPIVQKATAHVIGPGHLPTLAPTVGMTKMLTGEADSQWVSIVGVVRSVMSSGYNTFLDVALSDGTISAVTVRRPGADYAFMVDAKVRLRGNAAPTFNHQLQMTGAHILFPGLETVKVEDPAPAHPFALPIAPVSGLLRFAAESGLRRRVHVQGVVTLFWPGRQLCIQDAGRGLCAQTSKTTPVRPGQRVDVIGFPAIGPFTPTLADADYQVAPGSAEPITPIAVTTDGALKGNLDAKLVAVEARIIGADKTAKDPTILLSSGGAIFSAVLPALSLTGNTRAWQEGNLVRLVGICSVAANLAQTVVGGGFSVPESFRILLRSSQDVIVIQQRSWWTASHALWVLALALFFLAIGAVALFAQVRAFRRTASQLRLEMTERRRAEEATRYALDEMDYQAHHDSLTNLTNRLMFNRSIRESLELAEKNGTSVGLLYLDLDRFKTINDSLGHAAGDVLLKQAADRLTRVAPPGSMLSRLGGDEFAFLLPATRGIADAECAAQSVIDVLAVPFVIDGVPWHCPASIGISLFPEDASSAAVLQRNADTALYRAKRTAPGQFVTFDQSMSEQAERSMLIEKALRRGFEAGGFSLVYQPQFAAHGGLYGFEALLRLNDEVLGPISPAEFIGVAEDIGLIGAIGEWVLREACRQRVAWGYEWSSGVSVAVNVSPSQLKRGDFPLLVRKVLAQTGMPPELLELELTETGIFTDAHDSLIELRTLGVRIAVDDFGTGFSSLSSLNRAPVDSVKIDRSFIRDAACTPGTLPFIRTIVSLARSLGMMTVAEGVETPGQMEAVRAAGCDVVQGFLLSYPLPAAKAALLLRETPSGRSYEFEPGSLAVSPLLIRSIK